MRILISVWLIDFDQRSGSQPRGANRLSHSLSMDDNGSIRALHARPGTELAEQHAHLIFRNTAKHSKGIGAALVRHRSQLDCASGKMWSSRRVSNYLTLTNTLSANMSGLTASTPDSASSLGILIAMDPSVDAPL